MTVSSEAVPMPIEVLPAGHHAAIKSEVVPVAINLRPPDLHDTRARIEVVPVTCFFEPTICASTIGGVVAPLPILLVPTGDHDSIGVETVGRIANDDALRGHEAAIFELPLPAICSVHPVCGGYRGRRLGSRCRIGIRSGLRSGSWIDGRGGHRSRVN